SGPGAAPWATGSNESWGSPRESPGAIRACQPGAATASFRQRLQVPEEGRASALELIQATRRIAQRGDVLHRRLVQPPISAAGDQPLAGGGREARRQIAALGDDIKRTDLHGVPSMPPADDGRTTVRRASCVPVHHPSLTPVGWACERTAPC